MTTPANLRFIIAAMREHPTAYAVTNDALAAFAYGVLVGATDASVSDAWNAAVRAVLHPDDRGALAPDWNALPCSRVADVFEHAADALGLTTDAATKPVATTALPDAGRVVASQTFAFDDPPPPWHPYASREEWEAAVNRTAGILAGAIDPAAEARRAAAKRARALLAAGDVSACVAEMLAMMERA